MNLFWWLLLLLLLVVLFDRVGCNVDYRVVVHIVDIGVYLATLFPHT